MTPSHDDGLEQDGGCIKIAACSNAMKGVAEGVAEEVTLAVKEVVTDGVKLGVTDDDLEPVTVSVAVGLGVSELVALADGVMDAVGVNVAE
jgi:hypothetical protein